MTPSVADTLFLTRAMPLLADFDRLSGAGRYMRTAGDPTLRWLFLLGVIAIAGVWGAIFLWERWARRLRETVEEVDPGFAKLCSAHRLDGAGRSLLWRVVRGRSAGSMLTVFLDPSVLLRWGAEHPDEVDATAEMTRRLFGEDRARRAADSLAAGEAVSGPS